jgi:hypothetical protein
MASWGTAPCIDGIDVVPRFRGNVAGGGARPSVCIVQSPQKPHAFDISIISRSVRTGRP